MAPFLVHLCIRVLCSILFVTHTHHAQGKRKKRVVFRLLSTQVENTYTPVAYTLCRRLARKEIGQHSWFIYLFIN